MKKFCLLLLAMLISGSIFAKGESSHAQSRVATWQFSPSVADMNYAGKRHLDREWIPVISTSYRLSSDWRAQLLWGHLSSQYSAWGNNRNISGWVAMLDGIYSLPSYKWLHPYALGGLGMLNIRPRVNSDPSVEMNFNAGVGLEHQFSRYIGAYLEVRDLYTPNGGKNDWMGLFGVDVLL
ncbi:MAG: hypothetical protein AABY34_05360 [Pseudomonadota bacterium]